MSQKKKLCKEDILLRISHILMVTMIVVIFFHFINFMVQSLSLSKELSEATSNYISLHKSAEDLMNASDYLTEKVQRFTVINTPEDMDEYFDEIHNVRRRETAMETISDSNSDNMAAAQLRTAYDFSVTLMEREICAMKIVCDAIGHDAPYDEIKNAKIPDECAGMTSEEKIDFAQKMIHDSNYYEQKASIRNGMEGCINTLIDDTRRIQSDLNKEINTKMFYVRVFVIIQSAIILCTLVVTGFIKRAKNRSKAVEEAKKDDG